MLRPSTSLALLGLVLLGAGCSEARVAVSGSRGNGSPELCNGADDNDDGLVDESFRDPSGAYVHRDHCGGCGMACTANAVTLTSDCGVTELGPRCIATACVPGWALSRSGRCVPRSAHLCRTCLTDGDCGDFVGGVCATLVDDRRCTVTCTDDTECPRDYACHDDGFCLPPSGDCRCDPGDWFDVSCDIPVGDDACIGSASCRGGAMTACTGSVETCDGVDNDCNGIIDDPFVNALGAYGVDVRNCGGCGIDCTENPLPTHDLMCGGPPSEPRCAMLCDDAVDGIGVGDLIDADLLIGTGCECEVLSLDDPPGPIGSNATDVDLNCDGADGVVAQSYYVTPDGNDAASGSPLRPLATLATAIDAAAASLESTRPRPHVFVSAGTYSEVLTVVQGVHVHGGYSPDFRRRDPNAFVSEVVAPAMVSPGGAALVAVCGEAPLPTSIDGLRLKGAAASSEGLPAFGVFLDGCDARLTLSDSVVVAGEGVDGSDGTDGIQGEAAAGRAGDGEPPMPASEDAAHECMPGTANHALGGIGQEASCSTVDVSGGGGATARCAGLAAPDSLQRSGLAGSGAAGTLGGAGGNGGWDALGPIFADEGGCPTLVCCGLADFLVTGTYAIAEDGEAGRPGRDGTPGVGCNDALGSLQGVSWTATLATAGSDGTAGSGGGGGGAGGSARLRWSAGSCEWPDGIGGGGGGGGAGGCGGGRGGPGAGGSPSVGIYVGNGAAITSLSTLPTLERLTVQSAMPGDGGHGGGGGNGGQGGGGGAGGELPPEDRTIPSLSGSSFGGRGGQGGSGGTGGGGGGGCGGSSVGIWVDRSGNGVPSAPTSYATNNTFLLSPAGRGGAGGGGSTLGGAGPDGEREYVVER